MVSRLRVLVRVLDSPRESALPPVQVPVALVVPELVPLAAAAKPRAQVWPLEQASRSRVVIAPNRY